MFKILVDIYYYTRTMGLILSKKDWPGSLPRAYRLIVLRRVPQYILSYMSNKQPAGRAGRH
jgi:hypothetical protein